MSLPRQNFSEWLREEQNEAARQQEALRRFYARERHTPLTKNQRLAVAGLKWLGKLAVTVFLIWLLVTLWLSLPEHRFQP